MPDRFTGRYQGRGGLLFAAILLILLFLSSHYIASTFIDYAWWTEVHQVDTWVNLLLYGTGPVVVAVVLFFGLFWVAFRLGLRRVLEDPSAPIFVFISRNFLLRAGAAVLAVFATGVANATVDSWTVVRYFGGLRVSPPAGEFVDPIFGKALSFYLFGLPFYNMLLRTALVGIVLALVLYWLTSNADLLRRQLPSLGSNGMAFEF